MRGVLVLLGLAGITITIVRADDQEPVKTSYLLNLDLGREWRTTLELINLDDRQPVVTRPQDGVLRSRL
jgi:hypothetical protein